MSMGGAYISIKEDKLNSIIKNHESLSDYVFDEDNEKNGDVTISTLEQAWDAFNSVFSTTVPDILGVDVLEDVDLGETCNLIGQSDIAAMSHKLELISDDEFLAMLKSADYQNADFYWDNVWKDEGTFDELLGFFQEFKELLKDAIEEQKVVLFYVA